MTTKVWRRTAMVSQNLLLHITGLGIGWSFPCSYAQFTATEPSWVLSCPYPLIHTLMVVPSIGETEPLKTAASVSWSLQAASFLCLTPCSSLPYDPSVSLPPPAVPCPSPTPCLVCAMSFVACGCGTGLIGESYGCSQHVAISCLVLQLPHMAPLPEKEEAQFGLAFRDRAA